MGAGSLMNCGPLFKLEDPVLWDSRASEMREYSNTRIGCRDLQGPILSSRSMSGCRKVTDTKMAELIPRTFFRSPPRPDIALPSAGPVVIPTEVMTRLLC